MFAGYEGQGAILSTIGFRAVTATRSVSASVRLEFVQKIARRRRDERIVRNVHSLTVADHFLDVADTDNTAHIRFLFNTAFQKIGAMTKPE